MARIRTIKPEFWTDGKIVQLPFYVRLVFIGLWNFCDDAGYLLEEHDRIKMQIMPGDDVDVEASIDLLVACGLLSRHTLKSGGTALQINHFVDHQKISHPSPSKIAPEVSGKIRIRDEDRRKVAIKYGCEPGGSKDVQCYSCGMAGRIWWPRTQKNKPSFWVAFSGLELSHFIAESSGGLNSSENLVLCCRSCNRSMATDTPFSRIVQKIPEDSGVLLLEGKGEEGKGEEGKVPILSASETEGGRREYSEEFEEFWNEFPKQRRTKKQEAYRKWKLALKRADAGLLIRRASDYANSEQGRSEYAVMPSVWLSAAMWEDEPEAWIRSGRSEVVKPKVEKAEGAFF